MKNIHASCIKWKDNGILFVGDSGYGKSDLCLRFILNHQAVLVADDRVNLDIEQQKITASCPDKIKGLFEVRGIGIKKVPFVETVNLNLIVKLVENKEEVDRLPEPEFWDFEGIKIPLIKIWRGDFSAVEKIIAVLSFENTY